jgi:hypothetical protein
MLSCTKFIPLLLVILGFVSCPMAVDEALLLVVEDDIKPIIEITSPLMNSFYKGLIKVEGIAADSAFEHGDNKGKLRTLDISLVTEPRLDRKVTFEEDGSWKIEPPLPFNYDANNNTFTFDIDVVKENLTGPQVFEFSAEDRNGNPSLPVSVYVQQDTVGPHVDLVAPADGYQYDYSLVLINGVAKNSADPADPSANTIAELSWICGTRNGGLVIDASNDPDGDGIYENGNFTFDSSNGAFSDNFTIPATESGNLDFKFTAEDYSGIKRTVTHELLDTMPGPTLTITSGDQWYSSAVTTKVTVAGNVDLTNLSGMSYKVDQDGPDQFGSVGNADPWQFSFNPDGSPDLLGELEVTVTATDLANRESQSICYVYDDPNKPTINPGSTVGPGNAYIDLTFSEGVYTGKATGGPLSPVGNNGLVKGDFDIDFTRNGGSATGASISSLTQTDGFSPLAGGETAIRAYLSISGTPEGVETVELNPDHGTDIYDYLGNPMAATQTTGLLTLRDQNPPTFVSASLASNNGYFDVSFNEPVYTGSGGSGALVPGDLKIAFSQNGGSASGAVITSLTQADGTTALAGGETDIRVYLSVSGTPSGVETVAVIPFSGASLYDQSGNPMDAGESTAAETLADQLPPLIQSGVLVTANTYVDVHFSEPVYTNSDGTGKLVTGDFDINFQQNGGTATLTINVLKAEGGGTLLEGADGVRVRFSISGTPSGQESVEIKPDTAFSIYDAAGNAMSGSSSTGVKYLFDQLAPGIASGALAGDNYTINITFSEPVYTTAGSGALVPGDLDISVQQNGGNASSATIDSLTATDGMTPLAGGETVVQAHVSYDNTPDGQESVSISPPNDSIYDAAGNDMSGGETTGSIDLN